MTDESERPSDRALAEADVDQAIRQENWAGALFRLCDYFWAITKDATCDDSRVKYAKELARQLEMAVGLKAALVSGASINDVVRKKVIRTAKLARRTAKKDHEARPN